MLTRHLYKSNFFKSFVSLREILPFWTLNIDTECLHIILFIYWFFFLQTFEVPTVCEYNHRIRKSKNLKKNILGGWVEHFHFMYILSHFFILYCSFPEEGCCRARCWRNTSACTCRVKPGHDTDNGPCTMLATVPCSILKCGQEVSVCVTDTEGKEASCNVFIYNPMWL